MAPGDVSVDQDVGKSQVSHNDTPIPTMIILSMYYMHVSHRIIIHFARGRALGVTGMMCLLQLFYDKKIIKPWIILEK